MKTLFVCLLFLCAQVVMATDYHIRVISNTDGHLFNPYSIDEYGAVVGALEIAGGEGGSKAFVWNGSVDLLPSIGAPTSTVGGDFQLLDSTVAIDRAAGVSLVWSNGTTYLYGDQVSSVVSIAGSGVEPIALGVGNTVLYERNGPGPDSFGLSIMGQTVASWPLYDFDASYVASAVTSSGTVVGTKVSTFPDGSASYRAFVTEGSGVRVLEGVNSFAFDASDNGVLVGTTFEFVNSTIGINIDRRGNIESYDNVASASAVTWSSEGEMSVLESSTGTNTFATAIDSSGRYVVGSSMTLNGTLAPAAWVNGSYVDLSVYNHSGFVQERAHDVNSIGQIVTSGTATDGRSFFAVLTPIPDVSAPALSQLSTLERIGVFNGTGFSSFNMNDVASASSVYVIAHGWAPDGSSSDTIAWQGGVSWYTTAALSILEHDPSATVLAYSWLDESSTSTVLSASSSQAYTVTNGYRLGDALVQIDSVVGLDGVDLHLIGHSHGSKVVTQGAVIAESAGIDVVELVLLDSPESSLTLAGSAVALSGGGNGLGHWLSLLNDVGGIGTDNTVVRNYISEFGLEYDVLGVENTVLDTTGIDGTAARHSYVIDWYFSEGIEQAAVAAKSDLLNSESIQALGLRTEWISDADVFSRELAWDELLSTDTGTSRLVVFDGMSEIAVDFDLEAGPDATFGIWIDGELVYTREQLGLSTGDSLLDGSRAIIDVSSYNLGNHVVTLESSEGIVWFDSIRSRAQSTPEPTRTMLLFVSLCAVVMRRRRE